MPKFWMENLENCCGDWQPGCVEEMPGGLVSRGENGHLSEQSSDCLVLCSATGDENASCCEFAIDFQVFTERVWQIGGGILESEKLDLVTEETGQCGSFCSDTRLRAKSEA